MEPASCGFALRARAEIPLTQTRRTFRSRILVGLVAAAAISLGAVFGYQHYQRWRLARLLRSSRQYLKQQDHRSAALTAQEAIGLAPKDLEASTLLADILEQARSIEAVSWRRRAADLSPGSSSNALLWANTALRFGDFIGADQALARVPPTDRDTVLFHQLAAGLALGAKQLDLAEFHFAAAAQKDPTNRLMQLNLAVLQLQSPNSAKVNQGRQVLERLKSERACELPALRGLLAFAIRHGERAAIDQYATQLERAAAARFDDRVLALEGFRRAGRADFPAQLRALQAQALARPQDVFELLSWMNQHELAEQASRWIETLPPPMLRQLPVPLAVAETFARQSRWSLLRDFVNGTPWSQWEFMRAAWLARVEREQDHLREYRARWTEAVRLTSGDPGLLWLLAQSANSWQWESEAEELWWAIANGRAGQRPALFTLSRLYLQRKETAKLLKVAERLYALEPENPIAKNNVAALSLLLKKNQGLAHQWAEENHRAYPASAAFASTLAFSQLTEGRAAEALELLGHYRESEFTSPGMALYFALVLQATNQKEKAAEYFRKAEPGSALLPEEEALLRAAMTR